jgi:hypothetical protein
VISSLSVAWIGAAGAVSVATAAVISHLGWRSSASRG